MMSEAKQGLPDKEAGCTLLSGATHAGPFPLLIEPRNRS